MAAPHGLQDLSSPSRDSTQATAVKVPSPNHWTAREFPIYFNIYLRLRFRWTVKNNFSYFLHKAITVVTAVMLCVHFDSEH